AGGAGAGGAANAAGVSSAQAAAARPRMSTEQLLPLLLVPLLASAALPAIGSFPTWVTLTVAGLAMGMIIFIIASGLRLVFGLMDVLNFGHGVFIALGAFVAVSVLGPMAALTGSESLSANLLAIGVAMVVAMAVAGAIGYAFERLIVRPVYG